jgi:hypothetical protein
MIASQFMRLGISKCTDLSFNLFNVDMIQIVHNAYGLYLDHRMIHESCFDSKYNYQTNRSIFKNVSSPNHCTVPEPCRAHRLHPPLRAVLGLKD